MSPMYDFESPCGAFLSTSRPMDADTQHKTCDCCGLEARRVYTTFSFHRYVEAYNPAVGKVVSSDREFRDDLKRASEEATIRTGIPHNFQPVPIAEMKPKDLSGLEATNKQRRDLGLSEPSRKLFT